MKRGGASLKPGRFVERVISVVESRNFERVITVLAVGFTILVVSGLVYGLVTNPPGAFLTQTAVRVFIPSIRVQSYSEIFVVATLYFLFFTGSLMYLWATQQRVSQRNTSYMLLFSAILIFISIVGLIGGYLSKLG